MIITGLIGTRRRWDGRYPGCILSGSKRRRRWLRRRRRRRLLLPIRRSFMRWISNP
jgi:hypothetical protein